MRIKTLKDLEKEVKEICSQDKWHRSTRSESDGKAGNIYEDLLGIPENNRRGADIMLSDGTKYEIKTSKSKGTAVTMAGLKPKDHTPQRKQIEEYGKVSLDGQKRFSSTFRVGKTNPRGLKTDIVGNRVVITDAKTGKEVMSWDIDDILDKLESKCGNVIHTTADRRKIDGVEEYNYKKSELYSDFNRKYARKLLEEGKIVIETRSKIKLNGSIRDHGTVFRIPRRYLSEFYNNVEIWADYGSQTQEYLYALA